MWPVSQAEMIEFLDLIGSQLPVYMKVREPFDAMVARVRESGLEGKRESVTTMSANVAMAEIRDALYLARQPDPAVDVHAIQLEAIKGLERQIDCISGRLDGIGDMVRDVANDVESLATDREMDDDLDDDDDDDDSAAVDLRVTIGPGDIFEIHGHFPSSFRDRASDSIRQSLDQLAGQLVGSSFVLKIA